MKEGENTMEKTAADRYFANNCFEEMAKRWEDKFYDIVGLVGEAEDITSIDGAFASSAQNKRVIQAIAAIVNAEDGKRGADFAENDKLSEAYEAELRKNGYSPNPDPPSRD